MKELKKWILEELPDTHEGWWTENSGDTFVKCAEKMIKAGMSAEEIKEILKSLYTAVCLEFGV